MPKRKTPPLPAKEQFVLDVALAARRRAVDGSRLNDPAAVVKGRRSIWRRAYAEGCTGT